MTAVPVVLAIIVMTTRALVRLVLLAHPGTFRSRFARELLDDIAQDIRQAGAIGTWAALGAGIRAVADAVRGLASERPLIVTSTVGARAKPPKHDEVKSMRTWLSDAWQDVRLGVRGFARERGFSASVILTLALGIGVNAAMFGVVYRLILSGPAHVREPERVRRMQATSQPPGRDVRQSGWFGYAAYDALRREGRLFDAVAAYSVAEDGAILGRGLEARRINQGEATASLFPLLGVTPAAGRFFTQEEDDVVAPAKVAVIGHSLWLRDFGGREDAIGTPIVIDNASYTIVGVAPRGFTGPDLVRVDVWLPESVIGRRTAKNWTQSWNNWWLSVVVRLKPEVTAEQADAESTAIYRRAYTGTSEVERKTTLAVRPLVTTRHGLESMESRVTAWLLAVAGVVLLVACANVINLVLAQGIRRRREMAVRSALGAGRGRLVRLLVAEGLTLAVAGGAVGLGVAYVAGSLMRAWLLPNVEWPTGFVDVGVAAVATALALPCGIIVCLLPALRGSTPNVTDALKAGVREGGGRRGRARATLTVVQAALSAMLLVGAGLFVFSLERIHAMDLGLQPAHVLTFGVMRPAVANIPDEIERQRERDRRSAFYPMVLERLKQRPEIEAASLAIGLPFAGGFGEDIRVPGRQEVPQLKGGGPYLSAVSADYFRTVGTRIVRGRGFLADDRKGTRPVAVVNETMAATLWPGEDAIGKRFSRGQQEEQGFEVVGIVADARTTWLEREQPLMVYVPYWWRSRPTMSLLIRTEGDPLSLLPAVRRALQNVDAEIAIGEARPLDQVVDSAMAGRRYQTQLFVTFGITALLIATLGVYAVAAHGISRRRREMNIRVALGARASQVVGLTLRQGMTPVLAGAAAGIAGAVAAGRLAAGLLFEVQPGDPRIITAIVAVVVLAGLATCAVATRRGLAIDPARALRED